MGGARLWLGWRGLETAIAFTRNVRTTCPSVTSCITCKLGEAAKLNRKEAAKGHGNQGVWRLMGENWGMGTCPWVTGEWLRALEVCVSLTICALFRNPEHGLGCIFFPPSSLFLSSLSHCFLSSFHFIFQAVFIHICFVLDTSPCAEVTNGHTASWGLCGSLVGNRWPMFSFPNPAQSLQG